MNTASSQQQQVAAPSTTSQGQFNNIAPRTREERVSQYPTLNLYRHLKRTVKRLRYRGSRSVLAALSNTLINRTSTTLIRYRLTL